MMVVLRRRADGAQALASSRFSLLAVAAALGVGLWLSALNVRYRDVRYVVPFLVAVLAVRHAGRLLRAAWCREPWRTLYALNPWSAWWRASAGRCSATPAPSGR